MKIDIKTWDEYIAKLRRINRRAATEMEALLNRLKERPNLERREETIVDYAFRLATRYGEAAGAAACEMYDAIASASGRNVPPADPADTATFAETAKAIRGTIKNKSEDAVPSTVGRLVKQVGADTMLKNAARDGAQFAWVPHGDTCPFCIMLASNGWQYVSKKTLRRGHAEHIHANCDCEYVVRFSEQDGVAGYDPDHYKAIYDNADGYNWQQKLRSMEHDQHEAHKDEINARKRAEYARRNEFKSVYKKYINNATPGVGVINIPKGRIIKNNEEKNLRLIHSQFGGDISMLVEKDQYKVKYPDYCWRKKYWEEKEPKAFTKNAVDKNIQEALHQIKNNPGGVVLDIGRSPMPVDTVKEIALDRLRRSSPFNCDLILIRNGMIEEVWRYKKIKR